MNALGYSCGRCAYWHRLHDGEAGECRIEPPRSFVFPVMMPNSASQIMNAREPQMALQIVGQSAFPQTTASTWCGECALLDPEVETP